MTDRRAFFLVLAVLAIDAIGIGIVFPILPDLMAKVGAEDLAQGSVWGGVLMASYAAAQFLFAPIVGSLSDAYGRRPILILALALLALDYVIMALADSFWLLLVGRTLAGMAGATYITATAYISDISEPEQRAANFGLIGAAFGIGFVLGPAIGGLAAGISVTAPFWIAAIATAIGMVFAIFYLPESLRPENKRAFGKRDLNPFGLMVDAFRIPGLAVPLICIFLFEFANLVYPTLWAFWTKELFGWSGLIIGLTLSAYGVAIAVVQAGIMPLAIRHLGEYRTLIWGLILAAIVMVGYGFTSVLWLFWILLPLAALTDMVPPTLTAMSANLVSEDRQGLVQGVIASLASVAAVVAPLVFTFVFQMFVGEDAIIYLPGAPFLLSAALVVVILPIAVRQRPTTAKKRA